MPSRAPNAWRSSILFGSQTCPRHSNGRGSFSSASMQLAARVGLPARLIKRVVDSLKDECVFAALPQVHLCVTTVSFVVFTRCGNPPGDGGALASKRPHVGSAMGKRPDIVDPQYFEAHIHGPRIVPATHLAIDQDQREDRARIRTLVRNNMGLWCVSTVGPGHRYAPMGSDIRRIGLAAVIGLCAVASLALGLLVAMHYRTRAGTGRAHRSSASAAAAHAAASAALPAPSSRKGSCR